MRSLATLLAVLAVSVLPVPVVADDVPPGRAAQPADPGPATPVGDAAELPSTETDAQVFGLIGAAALVLGGAMILGARAVRRRRDAGPG